MGRPGARSSGSTHRSSSRSSGSMHRVSSRSSSSTHRTSFSRPTRSYDSSYSRNGSSYITDDYQSYNHYRGHRTSDYEGDKSDFMVFIIVLAIMLVLVFSFIKVGTGSSRKQESSLERVRLETGYAFMNDCVEDELDWVNEKYLSKGLKKFYEDTGAQPYIWLRAYDGVDWSDDEEYDIATRFYDTQFADRQDVVLYVYFEESDPNEVGNMALIHGTQSGTIMDAEAEDIFWNYLDSDWEIYNEDETEEMFISIFTQTGKSIMYHKTNIFDVVKVITVLCCILAVGCTIAFVTTRVIARSREKSKETERILKTSLDNLAEDKEDDLLNKYK